MAFHDHIMSSYINRQCLVLRCVLGMVWGSCGCNLAHQPYKAVGAANKCLTDGQLVAAKLKAAGEATVCLGCMDISLNDIK